MGNAGVARGCDCWGYGSGGVGLELAWWGAVSGFKPAARGQLADAAVWVEVGDFFQDIFDVLRGVEPEKPAVVHQGEEDSGSARAFFGPGEHPVLSAHGDMSLAELGVVLSSLILPSLRKRVSPSQ